MNTEPLANRVLANLLTSYGLPMTYDESVAEFMGGSLGRVREIAEQRLGGRLLPPDFEARYHATLFELFEEDLDVVPGARTLLDCLISPSCVASSGTHERIRFTLGKVGLLDRFEGRIFSAEDVSRGKPAPDLFLHAAARMGVAPGRCAVVEDTALGVAAANAAGMTSFGYAGMTPSDRLHEATGGVFPELVDLVPVLGSPL